jgi:hypothetical protein
VNYHIIQFSPAFCRFALLRKCGPIRLAQVRSQQLNVINATIYVPVIQYVEFVEYPIEYEACQPVLSEQTILLCNSLWRVTKKSLTHEQ